MVLPAALFIPLIVPIHFPLLTDISRCCSSASRCGSSNRPGIWTTRPRLVLANPLILILGLSPLFPGTDSHTQVWHIPQTGEIFPTYEEYLNRYVGTQYRQPTEKCTSLTFESSLEFYKQVGASQASFSRSGPPPPLSVQVGSCSHTLCMQSRFICQITGHSNLTFFEALRSEVCKRVGALRSPSALDPISFKWAR